MRTTSSRPLAWRLCAALVLASAACGSSSPASGAAEIAAPQRIVTLGGPISETVFSLGAGERVVGVDRSSLYPEAATRLPQVGYYRQFSAEGVLGLRPDVVLVSDEAGPAAALDHVRAAGVRVEPVPAARGLDDARANIRTIAAVVGADPSALLADLERELAEVEALRARTTARPRVLFVYARGPGRLLIGGRDTPAAEVLRLAAADNAGDALAGMKPWSPEAVVAAAPDAVVLPTRGLDSLGGAAALLAMPGLAETPAGRARRVVAVDDLELLGFGPRIGRGLRALLLGLHPELAERAP
ncbi:MAG: ABC transporter substrate-binding protein [Myxococcales bacterium]|nr:ABC transporter substrate-binding protein [Myxococcales bacterium]